jgi:transposase-like protein
MKNCKFCGSENLVKNGFVHGNQRFKCKNCKKEQLEKDGRQKYSQKVIKTAFILFSEGNNYRTTAKILSKVFRKKISYQLVIHWIRNKVAQMPENPVQNDKSRNIAVVEMDELYTYFKKKRITSEFGLLLTETHCVCLHFTSATETK